MNKEFSQGSNRAESTERADQVLESLFSHASARKRAPAGDERAVREALRGEWLDISRRRRRRNWYSIGVAASLLLALAISINGLNRDVPAPPSVLVASVQKQSGDIFVRGADQDPAAQRRLAGAGLFAGQVISTSPEARLALELASGESVRLDEETEIVLTSRSGIELLRGRLYIDSGADGAPRTARDALAITTFAGVIRHLGTQYIAAVHGAAVAVSVREGRVSIRVAGEESVASPGQRLSVTGDGEATLSAIPTHGPLWSWAELATPGYVLDGRSAFDFIQWVGRETGRAVAFDGDGAERLARATELRGSIDLEPLRALELMLQTSDLKPTVENGTIRIALQDR